MYFLGQMYVAASRAKTLEGLVIRNFSADKVIVDERVVLFYENLEKHQAFGDLPHGAPLIVLDLNGLLLDKKTSTGRPYLRDFLNFALDNFHVVVWSSAMKKTVDRTI